MMTNDERREVVRRLRSVYPRTKLEGVKLAAKWYEALCAAVGGKRDPWMGIIALCNRLADLIEPEPERTCHNVSNDEKWFTCSECGANVYGGSYRHSFVDESGVRWYTTANKPGWNYCPNCGARVTGDEK